MLPKKVERDKLLAKAQKEEALRKEQVANTKRIAAVAKANQEKEMLVQRTAAILNDIEKEILNAIKDGRRQREWRFGDGKTPDLAWINAVKTLRHANKDYTFNIISTSVLYNNYWAAANVEGVTEREWWEPVWQLTASW